MSRPPKDNNASPYQDELIEGHDYDGIQEYDNPMPAWWLWIFYATIAWSVFYVAALGAGFIDDYDAQLERGIDRVAEQRAAAQELSPAIEVDQEYLDGLVSDADALAAGERAYGTRCAMCHGAQGEGGIGSALNTKEWIHADTKLGHYEIIRDGISAVGMPAHSGLMSNEDMAAVTVYIHSF